MRRAWLLLLGLATGLVASCFDAPSAAVMFSCDPVSAPACPDGYTCEADGCCHRNGSDVSEHAGECKTIGTDGGTDATSLLTTESSGTDTGSSGTSTDTGSSGSDSSGTGSTDTSATDATSTGDDASSSGAGSSDTGASSTG